MQDPRNRPDDKSPEAEAIRQRLDELERDGGTVQHVPAGRVDAADERFDEQIRVAKLGGDHLWVAAAMYVVSIENIQGPDILLDAENLATIRVGCFICEKPYEPQLAKRRCRGAQLHQGWN